MTEVRSFFKSPKVRGRDRYAKARAEVIERSQGRCEAAIEGVCRTVGSNAHHKRIKAQGGKDDPSNLLWVCGSGTTGCHGWIHANPERAKALGLLVSGFDAAPAVGYVVPATRLYDQDAEA